MCPMPNLFLHDCADKTNFPSIIGETFSIESKCFPFSFFEEKNAFCFKTICDNEQFHYKVQMKDYEFVCEYDGQVLKYPYENNVTFECPSILIMCPDLICPYNCAGRGYCNHELVRPKCICFDENDKSPGCTATENIHFMNVKHDTNNE